MTLAADLKRIMHENLGDAPQGCTVLLSSGVDSTSILLALRELGKEPVAASFMVDGHVSTDFSLARRNARALKVPFIPVVLPRGLEELAEDVRTLMRAGAKSKTDIECGWPVWRACKELPGAVAMGSCADGHFGLSKKAMIHYRDETRLLDAYRASLFNNPGYAQTKLLQDLLPDKKMFVPYRDPGIVDLFMGQSWATLNKPKQKQPIRDAWPDIARLKTGRHTNLQLGDSMIAELFKGLRNPDEVSVVKTYNRMRREL